MAKVYSIDSENLSTFGSVTTRDLDPFGSLTNQSLGLFGGADISALYPYYLTLNPESYTASDFARITLNKGISGTDFVTQADSIFVRSQFNRLFSDTQVILEETTFAVSKKLLDEVISLSFTILNLNKPLVDLIITDDKKHLHSQKIVNDLIQNLDDNETLNFNKGLFDNQSLFDQIQSFGITKLLQDFANPVDLIEIPDGSTFQLNKTLRNTVDNIVDEISSFVIDKKLENDDAYGLDQPALHSHKPFSDEQYLNDYSYFSLIKALFDDQIINDITSFVVGKSLLDSQSIDDVTYLTLDKLLYDLVDNVNDILQRIDFSKSITDIQLIDDAIQSFAVEKLLEDFANPVDLIAIPDGSTFQLNKTLRNTVLSSDLVSFEWNYNRTFDDINRIDDNDTLSFTKVLFDNQYLNDIIQSISVNKLLQEQSIVNDASSFDVSKTIDTEVVTPNERKYLTLDKIFSDDFTNLGNIFLPFTSNIDLNAGNGYYDFAISYPGFIDFNNGQYSLKNDSSIFDTLVSVNIGKVLFDSQSAFDQLQSFTFNKTLEDFANPVDLIEIPDGSTFQLNKTLRNTVLSSDLVSFEWNYNRTFDENVSNIDDLITQIVIGKSLFNVQFVNDTLQTIRLDKSLTDNINNIVDSETLSFTKVINDYEYALDNIQSFSITKLLQDFANPVDLITIPDGSTFELNKSLRNTVDNITDDLTRIVDYNRSHSDSQTTFDIQSLAVIKKLSDSVTILDEFESTEDILSDQSDSTSIFESLDYTFGKTLKDTFTTDDLSALSFITSRSDFLNNISDDETLSFGKAINDNEYIDDVIQSFDITKLLQDFANPVDLIEIPDGSTFQLNKTLRNTVLSSDLVSFEWNYNRTHGDSQSTFDVQSFNVTKTLADFVTVLDELLTTEDITNNQTDSTSVFELLSYSFGKKLYDTFTTDDFNVLQFTKSTGDITNGFNEKQTFVFGKSINDYEYALDNIQSFSITKLLQDFANPIDLVAIPDGSTFELNKTLRNTVDNITDNLTRIVDYNRSHSDSQTTSDALSSNVVKFFKDSVTIFDELLQGRDSVESQSDFTSVFETSKYNFNKSLREIAIVFENISQLINKHFSEDSSIYDTTLLHFDKGIIDNTLSTNDNNTYALNKSFAEYFTSNTYNNLSSDQDYENQSLGNFDFNVGNASFDYETGNFNFTDVIFDTLQSINVNKFLEDFANPIDLVNIPDGSIFQLNKTLRNTVLPSDNLSKIANYIRDYEDNQSLVDDQIFETNKVLSESLLPSDLNQKILGKYFADFVSISDSASIFRGRSQSTIDNTVITDSNIIALNKVINNSSVITDTSTKSIVKILRDFILVNDSANINQGGNDYESNQGDLSNIEDSGYLFMTDYADITYFAEDYVGESRTFT